MSETLAPGTVLRGKFRVDKAWARGGMSRIYLGNPMRGAGMVAIKQIALTYKAQEAQEDLRQFRTEYELLSKLTHPCLPMALDFFEENGHHYLVEEFIPGETVQSMLEQGRMQPERAVKIALQLLEVLHYLHARGVVYRDVKPDNLMLTRKGTLRLIDFGAARRWKPGAARDTIPLGTPGFASPEAYGSAQTDPRSDLYSVGAVLHFMLTGKDPTQGEAWKFAPPHEVATAVPEPLSRVVMKALQLDPMQRYQSARAMRVALRYPPADVPAAPAPGRLLGVSLLPPAPQKAEDVRKARRAPSRFTDAIRTVRRDAVSSYLSPWWTIVSLLLFIPMLATAYGTLFLVDRVTAPVAILGTFAFAAFYLPAYLRWRLYRTTEATFYEEGLRILNPLSEEICQDLAWSEIVSVRVLKRNGSSSREAEIATAVSETLLPGAWPGFDEVISAVVKQADLTPGDATSHPNLVAIYERTRL